MCGAVRHGAECFNFYFPQEPRFFLGGGDASHDIADFVRLCMAAGRGYPAIHTWRYGSFLVVSQELDSEYLIIWDGFEGKPWSYRNSAGLHRVTCIWCKCDVFLDHVQVECLLSTLHLTMPWHQVWWNSCLQESKTATHFLWIQLFTWKKFHEIALKDVESWKPQIIRRAFSANALCWPRCGLSVTRAGTRCSMPFAKAHMRG